MHPIDPRHGGVNTEAVDAMELVHSADLSPDGALVAWSVSRIEGDVERRGLRLSRVAEPAAQAVAVAFGGNDHSPVFSPDGSRLAFLSSDGPVTRIVLARLSDAPDFAFEVLTDPDEPNRSVAGKPAWSPDGRRLAYSATLSTRVPGAPYRITRVIGWMDGLGLVDDATADIFVCDLDTGTHTRLTDDAWLNSQPTWLPSASGPGSPGSPGSPDSPDSVGEIPARIAFRAGCGPDEWRQSVAAVRSVAADRPNSPVVEHMRAPDFFSLAVSGDGRIAVTSSGTKPHSLGRLFAVGPEDNASVASGPWQLTDRTSGLGIDVNGDVLGDLAVPFADPDPRLLLHAGDALVRVHIEDRLEVHRVSLEGEPRNSTVLAGPGCFYPLAVAGQRLLYATGTLTTPPDLRVRDLDTGADVRISDTETHNRTCTVPCTVTDFRASALGGPEVQAKLLRPADAAGALPTVLLIHGGPKSAYGEVFVTDAHLLCAAGFGVLMVNPRGSRGYGMDFADAIIGAWGHDDFDDLMTALDVAVERGWADPDRLGVAGLSYGGFMSSWMISHTDRFRAAVVENPATNFVSFYGTSDAGLSFLPAVLDALPETDPDRYRDLSPITTAHLCTTPTLLIQGESDHRCPPEQSKQLYSVLRRAGCVAEMLMLPDASHEGSISGPVPARRAQNAALLGWMVRHV